MKQTRQKSSTASRSRGIQTHTDTEATKGRITTRTLTASTLLTEDSDWPGLQQVYQYTTHQKQKKTGQIKCHVQYGITSLTPQRASAADLLKLRREHWTIENKLHWIRDKRMPQAYEPAFFLKSKRNTGRFTGHTKITDALTFRSKT